MDSTVFYVHHVLGTEDISKDVDLISYERNGRKHFAITHSDMLKEGDSCIVIIRQRIPQKPDPRFLFAKTYSFDVALPISALPDVAEFLSETFVSIDKINFEDLVFGG